MKKMVALAVLMGISLSGCGSDPVKNSVVLALGQDNYQAVAAGANQLQAMQRANQGAKEQCAAVARSLVVQKVSVQQSGAFNSGNVGLVDTARSMTNLDREEFLHAIDVSSNYYATLSFTCQKTQASSRTPQQ